MELSDLPVAAWIAIGLLALVELGLFVYALVDWVRRPVEEFNGNRWLWLLLIAFLNIIGPIIYLLAGRKRSVVEAAAPATPTADRAKSAADALYGSPRDSGGDSGGEDAAR